MPPDDLAPNGARSSAGTVIVKFGSDLWDQHLKG